VLVYRAYLNIVALLILWAHIADTFLLLAWYPPPGLRDHSDLRTANCKTQTLLMLRRLIDATPMYCLAFDSGISQATAHRYMHEALDVIAHYAPSLHKVLAD